MLKSCFLKYNILDLIMGENYGHIQIEELFNLDNLSKRFFDICRTANLKTLKE